LEEAPIVAISPSISIAETSMPMPIHIPIPIPPRRGNEWGWIAGGYLVTSYTVHRQSLS
jgi:hypothetical protein